MVGTTSRCVLFNGETTIRTCLTQSLRKSFQRSTVLVAMFVFVLVIIFLQTVLPYMIGGLPERPFATVHRPKTCNHCFPYWFKTKLEPKYICRPQDRIDLLILITTIPSEKLARNAIRRTWCNMTSQAITTARCVFLFGDKYPRPTQNALEREASIYNDILQDTYEDTYYNLSLKVIMGYRWSMRRCSHARFVMRTAADNYVNVPQVLELIRSNSARLQDIMVGECRGFAVAYRWPHKWIVSFKEYSSFFYPPYCVGTTFLSSYELATAIVKISPNVPFFPLEDVYFGMCLELYNNKYKLGAVSGFATPLVSWGGFIFRAPQQPCSFPDPWYSIHNVGPAEIVRISQECRNKSVHRLGATAPGQGDYHTQEIGIVEF